ncbi:MAG: hypothetical protein J7L58_02500 [Thermoplasmata archaeon]|nr:hypothetical protein [Thermoplasmata archaeon]
MPVNSCFHFSHFSYGEEERKRQYWDNFFPLKWQRNGRKDKEEKSQGVRVK